MPHTTSTKKRLRQNARRNEKNRAIKHAIKTQIRRVADAVASNDKAKAEEAYRTACKRIDKASARRILHPNTAARRKSKLALSIANLSKTEA